ncbi:DsrE family protein [Aquifex aeolicus]|uniref:DsrE family protein n=1 Tax=Aquifex aeolicus TaxID=63363 RepID=UPI0002F1DB29|nr:DsrE family protein [Aquifex aeolicus]
MKILLFITSVPFAKDYNTIRNLTKYLCESGHEVTIFLSGNGVYYLLRPDAEELKNFGARVMFCSHAAHQRGVKEFPEWAESSSTYSLSQMMKDFDKTICFN